MTPVPPTTDARRWESLQVGRGIAAILVVLSHVTFAVFNHKHYAPYNPVGHLFDFGHAGVEFFFVLSGFIILHVHWRDVGRPQQWLNFVRKRVTRIYPIYWVVIGALLALYFAIPSFGEGHEKDPAVILSSFTLISFGQVSDTLKSMTITPIAWTLYHEIMFYAVFLTLIWSRRWGGLIMLAWIIASALPLAFPQMIGMGQVYIYLSPLHLLFLMGMGAAWAVRNWNIPMPAITAAFGTGLFFSIAGWEVVNQTVGNDWLSLGYGAACTIGLLGFVQLEREGRLGSSQLLVLLGEASYAIYLSHLPVLILMAKMQSKVPEILTPPMPLRYALFALMPVVVGTLFHLWVEKPLLAWLSPRRRPKATGVSPVAIPSTPTPVTTVQTAPVVPVTPQT